MGTLSCPLLVQCHTDPEPEALPDPSQLEVTLCFLSPAKSWLEPSPPVHPQKAVWHESPMPSAGKAAASTRGLQFSSTYAWQWGQMSHSDRNNQARRGQGAGHGLGEGKQCPASPAPASFPWPPRPSENLASIFLQGKPRPRVVSVSLGGPGHGQHGECAGLSPGPGLVDLRPGLHPSVGHGHQP